MRIRSIKPEFWRSDDVVSQAWETRLVFIGLWSYVDDNGVGRDKLSDICGDLFAHDLSEDPTETLRRVSTALDALVRGGQIQRYAVAGKRYLHITAWESHQRIQNPSKPRYPPPTCDDVEPPETVDTPSGEPTEGLGPGAEEQGSRGTEDKDDLAVARSPESTASDAEPTARTLVAEWLEHCAERPPERVIGHVSKELKLMLQEGIKYRDVRHGLALWQQKALHPSTLASVVHGVQSNRNGSAKPATTSQRVSAALELAQQYEAEEARP